MQRQSDKSTKNKSISIQPDKLRLSDSSNKQNILIIEDANQNKNKQEKLQCQNTDDRNSDDDNNQISQFHSISQNGIEYYKEYIIQTKLKYDSQIRKLEEFIEQLQESIKQKDQLLKKVMNNKQILDCIREEQNDQNQNIQAQIKSDKSSKSSEEFQLSLESKMITTMQDENKEIVKNRTNFNSNEEKMDKEQEPNKKDQNNDGEFKYSDGFSKFNACFTQDFTSQLQKEAIQIAQFSHSNLTKFESQFSNINTINHSRAHTTQKNSQNKYYSLYLREKEQRNRMKDTIQILQDRINNLERQEIQIKHQYAILSHKIGTMFNSALQYGGQSLVDYLQNSIGLVQKQLNKQMERQRCGKGLT